MEIEFSAFKSMTKFGKVFKKELRSRDSYLSHRKFSSKWHLRFSLISIYHKKRIRFIVNNRKSIWCNAARIRQFLKYTKEFKTCRESIRWNKVQSNIANKSIQTLKRLKLIKNWSFLILDFNLSGQVNMPQARINVYHWTSRRW